MSKWKVAAPIEIATAIATLHYYHQQHSGSRIWFWSREIKRETVGAFDFMSQKYTPIHHLIDRTLLRIIIWCIGYIVVYIKNQKKMLSTKRVVVRILLLYRRDVNKSQLEFYHRQKPAPCNWRSVHNIVSLYNKCVCQVDCPL